MDSWAEPCWVELRLWNKRALTLPSLLLIGPRDSLYTQTHLFTYSPTRIGAANLDRALSRLELDSILNTTCNAREYSTAHARTDRELLLRAQLLVAGISIAGESGSGSYVHVVISLGEKRGGGEREWIAGKYLSC